MIFTTLIFIILSGGTAVYGDSEHHIRSCSNEPYKLLKYVDPRSPLVASAQGHLKIWGTLHFEITVNNQGNVFAIKQNHEPEGTPRAYIKETRRALKQWQFEKSAKAQRCFYVTYVFHKPEIRDF